MPKICYQDKNFRIADQDKIDLINDILEEYSSQGYELTLRQLYYQMVARGYIPNNDKEYKKLGSLVNDGRMAGLIDWDLIIDITRSLRKNTHWNSPAEIIRAAHSSYALDKWQAQKYRVEVWVEKDAAISIISRICEQLDVAYFSCRGYTGQSAMWEASQRLLGYVRDSQKIVVIHLGDHDPSGIDMSRDIEERLNFFIEHDLEEDGWFPPWYDGGGIVQFERHALNWDQIVRYNPPPNPAKLTDTRAKKYIEEYGDESWELDALAPNVVEEIIRNAVEPYIDTDAMEEIEEQERVEKELLGKLSTQWREVAQKL